MDFWIDLRWAWSYNLLVVRDCDLLQVRIEPVMAGATSAECSEKNTIL